MTTTLKRKATNAALAGIVALGCAGAATTTALVSAATDATVAHADAWKKSNGGWWYQTGKTHATGWKQIGGKWYYFDNNGWMKTGWQSIGGKWYYFNGSGVMATGWNRVAGAWYYHTSSGAMKTGWNKIGSTWYYHNGSGIMLTGWQKIGGKWYYFNGSGVMQAGRWIGNSYVKNDGTMATNQWIGDYHVNANGVWDDTKETYRNMVIDNKYYGANGQVVTFSGSHTGPYTSKYDDYQWCNGSADKTVTIDFRDYFKAADTYTIDITCLLHYHRSNDPNLQNSTRGDEVVTIPSIVVQQSRLLNGGQIWQGYVYNKAQSETRYVTIECFNFNPSEGTIGIDIYESSRSSIGRYIGNKYSVKLI